MRETEEDLNLSDGCMYILSTCLYSSSPPVLSTTMSNLAPSAGQVPCIYLPSALLNVLSSLTAVPLLMSLSDSTIDTQGLISLSRFPPSPDTASWSRASTSKTQHNKKRHSDENANTSTWKLLKKNTLRENSTCNSTYSRLKTLYVKLLKENLRKHTWRNST